MHLRYLASFSGKLILKSESHFVSPVEEEVWNLWGMPRGMEAAIVPIVVELQILLLLK